MEPACGRASPPPPPHKNTMSPETISAAASYSEYLCPVHRLPKNTVLSQLRLDCAAIDAIDHMNAEQLRAYTRLALALNDTRVSSSLEVVAIGGSVLAGSGLQCHEIDGVVRPGASRISGRACSYANRLVAQLKAACPGMPSRD